jgi:hypothetical protein
MLARLVTPATQVLEIYQSRAWAGGPNMRPPAYSKRGDEMSHDDETAKVPLVQQLLDNSFLLLFLGVLIPTVVYTLWGVIDILLIPVAK